MEPLRPLFARPLEPLRAGTPPTNAADVGTDSEAPRLETEDGTSYDEPVGNSMIDEAAPKDGMLGLHVEGESGDDDERIIDPRQIQATQDARAAILKRTQWPMLP